MNPKEDGVLHINIYSKGATELGKLLSNFSKTPFTHPEHGNFQSVEGYWYWLKSGVCEDTLRSLSGFKAKEFGKTLDIVLCEEFEQNIITAIQCKLRQNKDLLKMLIESTLPFEHYYWYGDIDNPKVYNLDKYKWQIDEISRIRKVCQDYYK